MMPKFLWIKVTVRTSPDVCFYITLTYIDVALTNFVISIEKVLHHHYYQTVSTMFGVDKLNFKI